MRTITGFFKNGHPYFKIQVYGYSPQQIVNVEAMFDSGFTSFLSLPLAQCLQSAIILASTAKYTLADGSTSHTLLGVGTVILSPELQIAGTVSISMNTTETLLGMDLLKKIGGKLVVDINKDIVKIIDIPDQQLKLLPVKPITVVSNKKLPKQ